MEELKALLEELEGIYRTMVFVAGTTGLRISEVIGLRWSDCDFETGVVSIKAWNREAKETELETEASRKQVPLEAESAEVLLDWLDTASTTQQTELISRLRT